jgi:hypothetical protein
MAVGGGVRQPMTRAVEKEETIVASRDARHAGVLPR